MSSNSTLSDLAERARALIARPIRSRQTLMLRERFIFLNLVICTVFSVLVTGAILSVLVSETWRFFASEEVSFADFAFGTK
jgi:ABC-type phosphate transport system permease subunit